MLKTMDRRYSQSSCLISVAALRHNATLLRRRVSEGGKLGLVVKSEAYGHSLPLVVLATQDLADLFLVQTIDEALRVRSLVPNHRIVVVGPTPADALEEAAARSIELTLPFPEDLEALRLAGEKAGRPLSVHVKVETGTHRQGMEPDEVIPYVEAMKLVNSVQLRGISTHFADIEDTLDHSYALQQFSRLKEVHATLSTGMNEPLEFHCANSAATLLKPRTHGAFVRCGIALYGLWPSRETWLSVRDMQSDSGEVELKPALTWQATISQIKKVKPGSFVSYGRTYRTTSEANIAVLGVGYADGYDRLLSNGAHGILKGARVPVRGRVCMNMTMVDVSDVPECSAGDVVTLLGKDGGEEVSADQIASWAGTINYEIPTRIAADLPRIAVECPEHIAETLRLNGIRVQGS